VSRPLLVVLRPLGLGDLLTGVPAYRGLARRFPHHHRVLATPRALHELVPAIQAFDSVCDVAPLTPLPTELHDADIAVDLHGRGPASHRILLAARPRRLIAFANDAIARSRGGATWYADEHEVSRWARMLRAHGVAVDEADLLLALPERRSGSRGATVVHPGAASEARRWPLDRWTAVVRELLRNGHDVILTGSTSEASLTATLAERTGLSEFANLAGRTSLRELGAIVASAGLVVSGDTGVAHLATAYVTPSVTLFGPISPAQWGPPAHPRHRALWAGRTGDPHSTTIDPGLLALSVEDVLAAVSEFQATGRFRAHALAGMRLA